MAARPLAALVRRWTRQESLRRAGTQQAMARQAQAGYPILACLSRNVGPKRFTNPEIQSP